MIKIIDIKKILQPTAASFLVTENCNLACSYCFEKHNKNKMSYEVANQGIKFLFDNAKKNIDNGFGEQRVNILLFGGEPTLEPEILEFIIDEASAISSITKIPVSMNMITNGTILTTELERILSKGIYNVNLTVQLSVDGIQKVQDAFRITHNKKGSFQIVEKNIPKWKNLFKNKPDNLSIHGCLNDFSMKYLFESYKFFREDWGLKHIWFMPIHSNDWTQKDVNMYKEQLGKIADYILNRVEKEGNLNEIRNYAPLDRSLSNACDFSNKPCGAGNSFITITANGDISPCHHIYFNDPERQYIIGNIFDGIDDQKRLLFVEYDNNDLSCKIDDPDCDCYHCYRCIAENLCENGSILSVSRGYRCQMSKIEKEIQSYIKKEVEEYYKLGVLDRKDNKISSTIGNNPDNPACLCDSRGTQFNLIDSEETNNKFTLKADMISANKVEIKSDNIVTIKLAKSTYNKILERAEEEGLTIEEYTGLILEKQFLNNKIEDMYTSVTELIPEALTQIIKNL